MSSNTSTVAGFRMMWLLMTPADSSTPLLHEEHQSLTPQLTWDTQTPVAVAHAAADPVGTGV